MDRDLAVFIASLPKAELHVHLEGSIAPATLLRLAAKNRVPLPATSEATLIKFFRYRDFPHFIAAFDLVCECLREPADFTTIVIEAGAAAAAQNIWYQELHFNPEPRWRRHGIPFPDLLAGLNAGRVCVRERYGVELRWIADGIRDEPHPPASVAATVAMLTAEPALGVVALGLGGNEVGFPPALFVEPFAAARAAGFHVVAHAGETTGPASIAAALDLLGAERIGHGLSATADPALLARLAREQIPVELCPTSNLRTGVVARLADHPLPRLDAAGVPITISTDDPALFNTTLNDEYALLATAFGYDAAGIARIARQSFAAAFLPAGERERLLARFDAAVAPMLARLRCTWPNERR